MPRLSTLSNPTGLKDLEKNRVSIVVDDQGAKAAYSLIRLDVADASLPAMAHVVVVARRGNSEMRVDHGQVTCWDKSFIDVSEMGVDGVWTFRILFALPDSPKLLASIENIRPNGLGNSESLIALEPASDLGNVPWELVVLEQDGRAVIRFNRDVYQTAALAEADGYFACLVIPEAVRQLALWHTRDPATLAEPHWEPFKNWLSLHGITDEPQVDQSQDEKEKWCREVVSAFCERHRIAETLREFTKTGDHE